MLNADGYFDGTAIKTFTRVNAKKNQKVVITFLDEFIEEASPPARRTARGALSEYARPDLPNLRELEKKAWQESAEQKYEKKS
jgi:hypothetical protein